MYTQPSTGSVWQQHSKHWPALNHVCDPAAPVHGFKQLMDAEAVHDMRPRVTSAGELEAQPKSTRNWSQCL